MKHPRKWTGLYRSGALALVCAALIGLGACSSGVDQSVFDAEEAARKAAEAAVAEEERKRKEAEAEKKAAEEAQKQAEAEKKAAEEAQKQAEAEKKAAEEAQKQAEAEKKAAEAEAAEEERKRLAAEAEAAEEERKRLAAEAEAAEEERKRLAAEAAEAEEERKRKAAEAEKKAAEEEKKKAQQTLNRFVALEIVSAIPTASASTVPSVPATLSYNEPVLATATGATFTSTSTGSSGGWFKTTRSGSSEQRRDRVEIFSNVERPLLEDIRDYSARTTAPRGVTTTLPWGLTFDAQGKPTNHLNITTDNAGSIAASSSFPRPSTQRQGEKKTFTVTDRGPNQTEKDAAIAEKKRIDGVNNDNDDNNNETPYDTSNPDYRLAVRNTARYPERYSVDISGTLQGASGTFRCAGTSETGGSGNSCTVDLSGPDNYVFTNGTDVEWQFIPTSATSKVSVPDGEYIVVRMVVERANRDHSEY